MSLKKEKIPLNNNVHIIIRQKLQIQTILGNKKYIYWVANLLGAQDV